MSRSVPEWIGRDDNEAIPPRVRLRVWFRDNGRCKKCGRVLRAGDKSECDHVIALVNGGQNKESNLQTLCGWCHSAKTAADVTEKSRARRVQAKHASIKRKASGRGFQTNKAGRFKKRIDGRVERR